MLLLTTLPYFIVKIAWTKKSWNAPPEMILPHCTLKRRQQSHDRAYFCICAAETKHLSVVVVQCIPKGTNLPNYSLEGASNGFNSFLKEHSCSDAHNLRNFFTFFNIVAWLLYCFHFSLAKYQHFFKRFSIWETWFVWALFLFFEYSKALIYLKVWYNLGHVWHVVRCKH